MSTPFLAGLSTADRAFVAARSRGAARPSYVIAGLTPADDVSVQISEDFEAFLIVLSPDLKKSIVQFLSRVAPSGQNEDEAALIAEIVSVRTANYQQVYSDVGRDVAAYDAARTAFNAFLENASRSTPTDINEDSDEAPSSSTERTANILPDLAALNASISVPYQTFLRPEGLAAHDRITDTGVLYRYQNTAASRTRELLSWQTVLSTYLF